MKPAQIKIVDRIRKLLAMAEGARELGSQAEAEAFASAAQDLSIEHGISLLEVGKDVRTASFVRRKVARELKSRRCPVWQEELQLVVAKGFHCVNLIHPGTNLLTFAGSETDTQLAEYVFLRLVDFAERERAAARRRVKSEKGWIPNNFSNSFFEGFVFAIESRMRSRCAVAEEEQPGMMVRLSVITEEVMEWLGCTKYARQRLAPSTGDYEAYEEGAKAGRAAPIEPNAVTSHGSHQLSLGAE